MNRRWGLRARGTRPLVLAAVALLGVNCEDSTSANPADQIFEASLQRWNSVGPASYDLRLIRVCQCEVSSLSVLVQVRDEVVVARFYDGTQDPVEPENASLFPEVRGLFEIVRQALATNVFRISTEYHRDLGYPVRVELDLTPARSDDDVSYFVTELIPAQ